MLLYRSFSVCVNEDGVCVEERKMERDQRQGEKDSDRERYRESERKGAKKWGVVGKKGEEKERNGAKKQVGVGGEERARSE